MATLHHDGVIKKYGIKAMREIIQSIALASSQKRNVRLGNEALYPTLSVRVFSGLFGPIFFHRFTASSRPRMVPRVPLAFDCSKRR